MSSSFLWHTQEVDSVAHELKTDLEHGLSNKDAESRLVTYGFNEVPRTEKIPWSRFLMRLHISLMIPVMILAIVLMIVFEGRIGDIYENPLNKFAGVLVVTGILVINIAFSIFQELKSERMFRSVRKKIRTLLYAKVIRNGHIHRVKTVNLVPGDIICFEEGDQIGADGRLIECSNLSIDESVFGEVSEVVEKSLGVLNGDAQPESEHLKKNMVYMGSTVLAGNGKAIVTNTGIQTQIALKPKSSFVEEKINKRSLLETKLSNRGIWFACAAVVASAILWMILMLLQKPMLPSAMIGISFLIALWPAGLIESFTIAIIAGMKRLSDRGIIIRKPAEAEALAATTVICSDKTGIMTQNCMTVERIFVDGHIINVDANVYDPETERFLPVLEEKNPDLPLLLTIASMCNNTRVKNTPEGWVVLGDATEGAQIVAAMKGGIRKDELDLTLTKVEELPFDPKRRRKSSVYTAPNEEMYVFTQGSLETILDICSSIQLHGYMDSLDASRQDAIWKVKRNFAQSSMQSIAFAYRKLNQEMEEYVVDSVERDMVFVGMMGIVDPVQPDLKDAVDKCLSGDIAPIIITEDYVDTALAFAQQLEIVQNPSEALAGEELDILGEKEYFSLANKFSVYADISPEHKIRIIKTLQDRGAVVSFIGLKTSDIYAMKVADTGIAAGQSGSSVNIKASDIVLDKDSFASAIDSIAGIRGAYGNARKIIRYLLSGSITMALTILISMIVSIFWNGFPFPSLSLLHILWINLFAGCVCAITIAFNPLTPDSIKDGVYARGNIFDGDLLSKLPIRSILTVILVFISFFFSLGPESSWGANHLRAGTAIFTALMMTQLGFAFQCRRMPDEGFFRKYFSNKLLLGAAFLILALHLTIIYYEPASQIFGTGKLALTDWIPIIIAFVVCSLPLDELFGVRLIEEESQEQVELEDDEILEPEEIEE